MVFSSTFFLFIFLPAVFAVYFIVPKKFRGMRNLVLLAFSLFFYFFGEPKAIIVMLASIAANYIFAIVLDATRQRSVACRRIIIILSVIFNLGILGYFKYAGFFIENVNLIISNSLTIPQIVMPIGISFFTFQGMSYVFDVARGEVPAQKNIINVALYISLFPQLVAGPIVRYETIADELITRDESIDKISAGIRRFVIGLAKKVVVANSVGALAEEIFSIPVATLGTGEAWLGAIAYSFQILFDFSGYSDMAIGLGYIFGFKFCENFDYPYIANSITDFWRRWHMSLSSWFRDYVYIPLGGNRKGLLRQLFNILVVWMLTGLWHGAAWNFVLWGLYFALLLIIEKLFLGKLLQKIPRFIGHIYALLAVIVGWVFFNSSSFDQVTSILSAMFTPTLIDTPSSGHALSLLLEYKFELIVALFLCVPAAKLISERLCSETASEIKPKRTAALRLVRDIWICGLFLLCCACVVSSSFNPFIYFRF